MNEIFMRSGMNHCKLLNAFFQKLQDESQAQDKDEYCVVLCDEFELDRRFGGEKNAFNFSDLEVPYGTDGKGSRIFPIICGKPTASYSSYNKKPNKFKMPKMNGFYVKELKKSYRACKENQDFYRFLIENAKKFDLHKGMSLEQSKDNKGSNYLPKGE